MKRLFLFLLAALALTVLFTASTCGGRPAGQPVLPPPFHRTATSSTRAPCAPGWRITIRQHGTHYVFWDHDYNYVGLRENDGDFVGWIYNIPNDNTDPIGLYNLWTTANAARDSILDNHDVIAFKSCYPASAIPTPQLLQQYKTWYLAIRNVLDQHPDKIFVVMSQPPLHRLATNLTEADNARAFANWLKSAEFLQGHPNIVCFDLFDVLAAPNTPGSAHAQHAEVRVRAQPQQLRLAPQPRRQRRRRTALRRGPRRRRRVEQQHGGADAVADAADAGDPPEPVQPGRRGRLRTAGGHGGEGGRVRPAGTSSCGRCWTTSGKPARIRCAGMAATTRGKDAPAGVYLCRLQAGDAAVTKRMALVR